MRIALFLWILFLGTLTGNAQIKERVVVEGEKGQALPGVNIYMQNDSIVFSHVGYHTFKCTLRELEQLNYRVTLHEQPQRMQEVVVSGESRSPFLEWTEVASLPKPLYSFGGFLLDGKIYVVAGDETLLPKPGQAPKQMSIILPPYMYMISPLTCGKSIRTALCRAQDILLISTRIRFLYWAEKGFRQTGSWNIRTLRWKSMIWIKTRYISTR